MDVCVFFFLWHSSCKRSCAGRGGWHCGQLWHRTAVLAPVRTEEAAGCLWWWQLGRCRRCHTAEMWAASKSLYCFISLGDTSIFCMSGEWTRNHLWIGSLTNSSIKNIIIQFVDQKLIATHSKMHWVSNEDSGWKRFFSAQFTSKRFWPEHSFDSWCVLLWNVKKKHTRFIVLQGNPKFWCLTTCSYFRWHAPYFTGTTCIGEYKGMWWRLHFVAPAEDRSVLRAKIDICQQ